MTFDLVVVFKKVDRGWALLPQGVDQDQKLNSYI